MGTRTNRFLGMAPAVVLAVASVTLAAQGAKTTKDGVYTDAQATRGKTTYTEKCSSCHSDDLSGGAAPALAGDSFMSGWVGQTIDGLYDTIKERMPANDPGSLSAETSSDVLAFLLKSNKFPAGQTPLPSGAPLKQISIPKP